MNWGTAFFLLYFVAQATTMGRTVPEAIEKLLGNWLSIRSNFYFGDSVVVRKHQPPLPGLPWAAAPLKRIRGRRQHRRRTEKEAKNCFFFFFLICDDDVDRTRTVYVKDERGEWQRIHTRRETENGMKEIECVEWSSIAAPCRPRVFFNQEKKGARKNLECVGLGYNSCFIWTTHE